MLAPECYVTDGMNQNAQFVAYERAHYWPSCAVGEALHDICEIQSESTITDLVSHEDEFFTKGCEFNDHILAGQFGKALQTYHKIRAYALTHREDIKQAVKELNL